MTAWLAALAGGLSAAGCSRETLRSSLVPNQPPSVTLTSGPIDTTEAQFYAVRMHWLGFDPDGRVAYFEYAVLDSVASPDSVKVWRRTTKNDSTFIFRSTRPEVINAAGTRMTDLHTFVIRAVDDQGARSPASWRSFLSYTIAPSVRIFSPQPSDLLINRVRSAVFIQWRGDDDDGEFNKKPLKYKFKLFRADDPSFDLRDPLSLNRLAPGFAGWDSVSGDTTFAFYTDLVPSQIYVFALTGFDEAGAHDPVFSYNTNLLRFRVTLESFGPAISVFSNYIDYSYPSGGYSTDDSRRVRVEVPFGTRIRWSWYGTSGEATPMRRTRWKLDDRVELTDQTPRSDELADLHHWSQWHSVGQVRRDAYSVELPAFPGSGCDDPTYESHTLYIELEDFSGLVSLGMVEFIVLRPCSERDLLVVDDRRGPPDQFRGTPPNLTVNPPLGLWPTEAELDSFFFAVGNVPWKGYSPANCPAGFTNCPTTQLNSVPGVFAGYAFDTLDTRRALPDATFPLSLLARYRHVVWYVDAFSASALPTYGPLHDFLPITTLVYMNSPGRPNTLAVYSTWGGRLLFFGGGVVMGTVYGWIYPTLGYIWKTEGSSPALLPGRFVYDYLAMRSEVTSKPGTAVRVHPRRPAAFAGLSDLALKRTGDPLAPYRISGQYPNSATLEHVTQPLIVLEDQDPDPNRFDEVSVLDTLFAAYGPAVTPAGSPCGFYHHGSAHGPVVLLGFDLWSWRRSQIIANVDAILQDFWGLPRAPVDREPHLAAARSRPVP